MPWSSGQRHSPTSSNFSDIHAFVSIFVFVLVHVFFIVPMPKRVPKKGSKKVQKLVLKKVDKKVLPLLKVLEIWPKKVQSPKKMHKRLPNKGFQKSLRKKCNKTGLKKCDFLKSTKKSVFPSTNAKKGLLTVWSLHAKKRHISNARTGLTLV